jgi:hypothetical protein
MFLISFFNAAAEATAITTATTTFVAVAGVIVNGISKSLIG